MKVLLLTFEENEEDILTRILSCIGNRTEILEYEDRGILQFEGLCIDKYKRNVVREENEIERPEDLRVRTVANKSKMKVAIIQAIDRKVALDDIAMSKGIEFEELLDEIEAIVYSGTKLNIDYFLEDIMDEDHLLDIYDYFKESTTDDIDDALDELGDDFTEEEVRLVRIKFISEMAN